MRILFVDDEPNVLAGLRRLLRKHRKEWDMSFIEGGPAALDALERDRFDVLVTDMRMPQVDGVKLLTRSAELAPHMIRLVLSGHTETKAALQALPIAHDYLSKPCSPTALESVLKRAIHLYQTLAKAGLNGIVSKPDALPARPKVYSRLCEILARSGSDMSDVVELLESDVGLTMRILKVVNSAFFAGKEPIHDLKLAVTRLGSRLVKDLVLSAEVFDINAKTLGGIPLDLVYERANLTGTLARRLAPSEHASAAFLSGLLHEVGLLVMARAIPKDLRHAVWTAKDAGRPLESVLTERLGVTHADVAAYLVEFWGFAYTFAHAVANHLQPLTADTFAVDKAVRLAHLAVSEAMPLIPSAPDTRWRLDEEAVVGGLMDAADIRSFVTERRGG